ncbi:MAG: energy transducer TonB [Proteobacteria bacterium]|nr:MAG: energy transducer TonB [Pseudomonadota bacterium]
MRNLYLYSSILIGLNLSSLLLAEGLSKDGIQKVVKANTDQVRTCYEQFTKRTPSIVGKIRLEIKVDTEGRVLSTKTADNSFADNNIATCVESKVKRWRFPQPLPTDPATFSYPFTFGNEAEVAAAQASATTASSSSDGRVYKGRTFKKSNRPIDDVELLQKMANNPSIKAIGRSCDNLKVLRESCEKLEVKDRVACSAMTDFAPKKPFTPDWLLIEHPDAFRIESGTYFMGYWHISCEALGSK